VAAGAECPVAGAGEHDHADPAVPAGLEESLDQLLDGMRPEGIEHLGTIDCDGRDALLLRVEEGSEVGAHGFLLSITARVAGRVCRHSAPRPLASSVPPGNTRRCARCREPEVRTTIAASPIANFGFKAASES